MYVNSEKDLEDYICDNIEQFIVFLRTIYGEDKNIEFIGRQVVIGNSRIDLLFQILEKSKQPYTKTARIFIVVELKFRDAETKDVAQLSRYMNLLQSLEFDERTGDTEVFVKGVLLSKGLNEDVQEIQMYLNNCTNADITFVHIQTNINYIVDTYSRRAEYLESMTIDERLRLTEVKENGKKENGRS